MASLTRTTLRRTIGLRTGQPFFRKFGGSAGTASTNGTTTTLLDTTRLKEEDNYWRGSYIYFPATGDLREINAFTQSSSTVSWLAPVSATSVTASGVTYEIWSQFLPTQVHEAINYALQVAWPFFFGVGTDETIAVKESKGIKYTLPTTTQIRRLCQIHLMLYNSIIGTTTTTGTTTQVINSGASFTSADVGKFVAAYKDAGNATGEVRQVSAVVSGTEITVAAFSAALPSGAKYRLIDKNDTTPNILLVTNALVDAPDFPVQLWFGQHPAGYEGFPLHLTYEYEYPTLATEAATTTCPAEYLYAMTLSYLYLQKIAMAPAAELSNWETMHKATLQMADLYTRTHRFQHLPGVRVDHQATVSGVRADYPF
jgi:hypothetical protein